MHSKSHLKKVFTLSICIILTINLYSQKEDYIWLFGSSVADNLSDTVALDSTKGSTNFDFSYDPPRVYYDPDRIWDIRTTNASICNSEGEMQLYTNGQVVYDGNHNIVEDTINYNAQWDNWNIMWNGVLINDGLPTIQGALILPMPENERRYYIFYSSYELEISRTTKMNYAMVEKIDEEYHLIERDISLLEGDTLSSGNLNAVRHANGRDWWVIFGKRDHSAFYEYLLTPEGINYIGEKSIGTNFDSVRGQLYFSNIGDKLALCSLDKFGEDGAEVYIADFDRTTGEISNPVQDKLEGNSFSQGISFSPNGRYLYATDSERVYQYDLESSDIIESRQTVATYDGYIYYYPGDVDSVTALITEFGWMAQGPDGKIYISTTTGSTRRFHRINYPNRAGEACNVDQHSIVVPTSLGRGVPNFPNFRLGPLDGSPADTLGLNNHPIAKFRYVKDTVEDLRVHFFDLSYYDPIDYEWDFGDGTTSTELEPNHEYDDKGVYEVCLTVSNVYDTHTSCKTVMLGTTSTEDETLVVDVSVFPNPTRDYIMVCVHNYLALLGSIRIFDLKGNLVKVVSTNSSCEVVDLLDLPCGMYFYNVFDGNSVLATGKFIKS